MSLTVKQRVKAILAASRQARNSDKELWIIYAQKSGMDLTERQIEIFKKMPSTETLRRTRQIIQNTEGTLRPSQEITEHRYKKYQEMQRMADPEYVLEVLGKQGKVILPFGQ